MGTCRICKENPASLPEGLAEPRFCPKCWDTRLRQVFLEEDRFCIQRVFRASDAEKYLVFHADHEGGTTAVAQIVAVHDRLADHLEVSAFLYDRMNWDASVPFIYEQGVECEVATMDIFLGVLEAELVPSWRCHSWTAEVTRCQGEPFWIDSRDREAAPDPEE